MTKYDTLRSLKETIEKLRAAEILWSIIAQLESGQYEKEDFDIPIEDILSRLYDIKLKHLQRHNQVEDIEIRLNEVMGDSFILYIPSESKLIKQLKALYKRKKEQIYI